MALGQDGPVNSEFDYTYDALGRVSTETTSDGQWVYSYDADGQLTHAVFTPNASSSLPAQDLQYAYDDAGNRTQTIINGVTTAYTVNNVNEYTQVGNTTYTYDKDGNLATTTGGVTTTYAFNQENQLTGITNPTDTWSYQYDPFGNRVTTTHNGLTTQNLIDPAGLGNIAAQFDGSGNLIAHYTYGLGLVSQVSASGSAGYYDIELTGNTAGITGAAGTYVNTYAYLPFGQVVAVNGTLPNPFTFVGQFGVTSDGSGLLSMRARNYNPVNGQFVSNDPLGFAAGDPNLRRYVGNDPVTSVDPRGLCYYNLGFSFGGGLGFTGGLIIDSNGDVYSYLGAGASTPGAAISTTYSPGSVTEGASVVVSGTAGVGAGITGNFSYGLGQSPSNPETSVIRRLT